MKQPMDSTGQPIHVGDKVRYLGEVRTIKSFKPGEGWNGTAAIEFEEIQEFGGETSVDLVEKSTCSQPKSKDL